MCCFIGNRHPAPSISASTHGQRNELSKMAVRAQNRALWSHKGGVSQAGIKSSQVVQMMQKCAWCRPGGRPRGEPTNVCESRPFQFGLLGKYCTTWKKNVSLNLKHVQTVNSAELCFHLEDHRSIFGSFKRTDASADASSAAPQHCYPEPCWEVE